MSILFIGPLPDPLTGHSLACKVLYDELRKTEVVDVINLSRRDFSRGINSLARVYDVLSFAWQAWRKRKSSEIIYFTISESVSGNLKDLLIYCACFAQLPRMAIHLHGGAGIREIMKRENRILRAINALFLKRVGAVILLGQRHIDVFAGMVPRERIHVVPNFAQDEFFVTYDLIHGKFAQTDPLKLLFLSNLLPGKGHLELVEAFKALDSQTQARVQIDFAGGFESEVQKSDFLRSIESWHQVRYHGIVSGERKAELFRHAHVFCLPTYYLYEGQPISLLEAYASGCATITTDHSGILDVFADGVNGYCVAKRSPTALKIAIETALEEPARLEEMALINRSAAEKHYRTERYNSQLIHVIDDLRAQRTA